MHVVHCFYVLMFVYMDHVFELKPMYVCMYNIVTMVHQRVHLRITFICYLFNPT